MTVRLNQWVVKGRSGSSHPMRTLHGTINHPLFAIRATMLETSESLRHEVASGTAREHKSALGQFMTPATTARFMAGLFHPSPDGAFDLLDAGAGLGALASAALDRWQRGELGSGKASVVAHELDPAMREHLEPLLATYASRAGVRARVVGGDYIEHACAAIAGGAQMFSHAILNPPYKKMGAHSVHRDMLRGAGIEVVNYYAAFVALALAQVRHGGELVAIIPRSFCNGPYYRTFRDFLLRHSALRRLHLFDSRTQAFRDDGVLQENVILLLEKGGKQRDVQVSASADDTFTDARERSVPFGEIVLGADTERFIRIPTTEAEDPIDRALNISCSLTDLGISVSTGPVVDFRMKDHLRAMPSRSTVPLLYPAHFSGTSVSWPIEGMKKPNAIERNNETERWFFDGGFYTVVRRFSSKEERRRVVASVVRPTDFGSPPRIAFENHLNVFHSKKRGLSEHFAAGLAAYLNSTAVDTHVRLFSGHTQVNATDLRGMRFPSSDTLTELGKWATKQKGFNQSTLDARMEAILS